MFRKILMCSFAAGVLLDFAIQGHAQELRTPDILGIHLGMPINEAYVKLRDYDPEIEVEGGEYYLPVLGQQPVIFTLSLTRIPPPDWSDSFPNETVVVGLTAPPNPQVVWKVGRWVRFQIGQEMAKTSLINALRSKYGREGYLAEGGNLTTIYWIYDFQGNPLQGQDARICADFFNNDTSYHAGMIYPGEGKDLGIKMVNNKILYPFRQPVNLRHCQSMIYIVAQLHPGINRELIKLMTTAVVDAGLEAQATETTRALIRRAAEEAEKQRVEKARQREVPKL